MVAALGETTAGPSLPRMRDNMLESAEGRKILKDRPRVNSSTIDMDTLAQYPEGTFGRAYVTWLERCGVTPDTREPVRCHFVSKVVIHEITWNLGALYCGPRISIRNATLPRMSRLLSLHMFTPRKCRIRTCTQVLRICQSRSSHDSSLSCVWTPPT